MKNKLVCPYCGTELKKVSKINYACQNDECRMAKYMLGTKNMWLELTSRIERLNNTIVDLEKAGANRKDLEELVGDAQNLNYWLGVAKDRGIL